ncbi:MAG: PAS domain S-box protein [Bacteroidota bacterium]|nr:PAS domain S-box protein [Bacteroidota bacterium]
MKKDKILHKILLIEDNLGDIVLIKDYIEEQFSSPQITVARNYKESLAILDDTTTSFDVIVLDLNLPDKTGDSLINAILSHPKIICPVIVLTGYTDIEFSIKSISLGISDYLLKDELNAVTLYKSIIYAIERRASKLRLQESERKFSNLFNLSPQPMWVYDLETLKFILINEAAIIHYGYTEEEFFNIDLVQLFVPEEREQVKKTIKYVDSKRLAFSGSFRQIKKNGEKIEVEIYSTFLIIDKKPCRTVIAIDVTEKNRAEIKLTQAIIKTQEEERYAIGSELHDNICQILAGTIMSLSIIKPSLNADKATFLVNGIDNIKLASSEIRNLSHRLAPAFFDDMKLNESLLQLLSSIKPEGRFQTHLTFDKDLDNINLKRELQMNFYRIMQEQLNNILKYAKASIIEVSLSIISGNLRFEISDNGVGFDEAKVSKGIGFANMNRRAKLFSGSFNVASSPNKGCRVTITIPSEQLT